MQQKDEGGGEGEGEGESNNLRYAFPNMLGRRPECGSHVSRPRRECEVKVIQLQRAMLAVR